MKEMIKKVRERREGFTMAELLIVVAIIAVLVAIAIPVFTSQLHKAQDATDVANIRSYYADLQTQALTDGVKGAKLTTGDNYQKSIALSDGETITLKNVGYKVSKSTDGASYVVTYKCTETSCKSEYGTEKVFGGTTTTTTTPGTGEGQGN